jgi:L-ribulose-5-phosphate 4-epimerase
MGLYDSLKQSAWSANMQLQRHGLVIHTFGNVSVLDPRAGVFAIKPSGVPYEALTWEDLVILDLDCRVVEGKLRASSDTRTHAVLYRGLEGVRSVVHTHSTHAVAWAQALRPIPVLGTTHADLHPASIPVTPLLSDDAIQGDYEEETGKLILSTLQSLEDPTSQMMLVGGHGPFTWGKTPEQAVLNSLLLDEIARMALLTLQIAPSAVPLKASLIRKHFERKHGPSATYGQLENVNP